MKKHPNQLGQLISTKLTRNYGLNISLVDNNPFSSVTEFYAVPKPTGLGHKDDIPRFINNEIIKTVGNNKIQEGVREMDIIISPFSPETWEYIYAVKVIPLKDHDYVGFIADLTEKLETSKINILSLQSNPTFSEEPYSFWLLLDLSKFDEVKRIDEQINCRTETNLHDPYHFHYRNPEVKKAIHEIVKDIIRDTETRGIELLYNFSKETKKNYPKFWDKIISDKKFIKFKFSKGNGTVPSYVIHALSNIVDREIQYSIVSSPHQKSYFILRIFCDSDVMYIDIKNKDEIGSIEKISKVISDSFGNVLTGSAQIESVNGEACHYFTLIQCTPYESNMILSGLSKLHHVSEIIVYNCSSRIRDEIKKSKAWRYPKVVILSENRIKIYLYQRYRKFLDKYSLSEENIGNQLITGLILFVGRVMFYTISFFVVKMIFYLIGAKILNTSFKELLRSLLM